MIKKEQGLTEAEMDALVIADADDPEAWGEAVTVRPATSPLPEWAVRARHLDLAARFYVVSMLHRLGADAAVTFPRKEDVDITVIRESGQVLTIDVKTVSGSPEWRVAPFRASANHYLAFVWYASDEEPTAQPGVYIVSSERLRDFVAATGSESLPLNVLDHEMAAKDAWQPLAPAA